jgi:hypothetical protein
MAAACEGGAGRLEGGLRKMDGFTSRKRCRRCRLAPCICATAVQDDSVMIEGPGSPECTMPTLNRFCFAETKALRMKCVLLVNDGWVKASRIPSVCGLEHGDLHPLVRWFSLGEPRCTTG